MMLSARISVVFFTTLAAANSNADLKNDLSGYLLRAEACGLSGVVLVAHGDDVVFTAAYGWADKKHAIPMKADSVLEVGSISKQYTAACILRLADQHRVRLDA